jgi:hypothetical protein
MISQFVMKIFSQIFLKRSNIVLQAVTPSTAMFSVFPNSINPYDTRSWPFMFDVLHTKATYKVLMDAREFNALAESMTDLKMTVPVAAVSTTGRSGSTLLSQMMNAVKGTRVLAENPALNQVKMPLSVMVLLLETFLNASVVTFLLRGRTVKPWPTEKECSKHLSGLEQSGKRLRSGTNFS